MKTGRVQALLPLLLLITVTGCSLRQIAIGEMTDMMKDGRRAFETETDLEIARTALASNLKLLEALAIEDPENHELNLFLAEGYAAYSMGFVEDRMEQFEHSDPEESEYHRSRAITLYRRAENYALKILIDETGNENFAKLNADALKKELADEDSDLTPALFWYAFSKGAAINLQRDNLEALSELTEIEIMMNKVKEWQGEYYFGGAYLFEGIYYGSRSAMLGGDMQRAEAAFEKVEEITDGRLLMLYYYRARSICIFTQNEECFDRNIRKVLNAPVDILPGQQMASAIAKKKAARLAEQKEFYFLSESASFE